MLGAGRVLLSVPHHFLSQLCSSHSLAATLRMVGVKSVQPLRGLSNTKGGTSDRASSLQWGQQGQRQGNAGLE